MEFNRFDTIVVNEKEYIIIYILNLNENTYLYLINNEEENDDVSIVKVIQDNDKVTVIQIEDPNEFELVLSKILLENQEELKEIIEDKEI